MKKGCIFETAFGIKKILGLHSRPLIFDPFP